MARLYLCGVLVERGLGASVFGEHIGERLKVVEKVRVGEVAGFEVHEESWETDGYGGGEKERLVGGGFEEVQESGEEEAGGFFFGGEAEELGVEGDDFLLSGEDCQQVYGFMLAGQSVLFQTLAN